MPALEFALFAVAIPVLEGDDPAALSLSFCGFGTEMPRLDSACDTTAWAEGGNEPVAAATLPPKRTTGAANATTLAGNFGDATVLLVRAATTGRDRAFAANAVTVASRAASSSAVAGPRALWISAATRAYPGGASSGSTASAINQSAVVASR